jgi:hypothetical protein
MLKYRLIVAAYYLLVLFLPAFSLVTTVTSSSDSVNGSLRSAIARSNQGDTILFTIPGNDTVILKNEIAISKSMVLLGKNRATGHGITMRVASPGISDFRVFRIEIGSFDGSTPPVIIRNAVLRGGRVNGGGGVLFLSGNLYLDSVVVSDGKVDNGSGGGIYVASGKLRINNCTIANNMAVFVSTDGTSSAECRGGGIFANEGQMEITSSTLSDNSVLCNNTNTSARNPTDAQGGGIYYYSGYLCMINCSVVNNRAESRCASAIPSVNASGGAVYTYEGRLSLDHCTIINNTCSAQASGSYGKNANGGGVYDYDSPATFANCIMVSNAVENGASSSWMDVYSPTSASTSGKALNCIIDTTSGINTIACLAKQPLSQIFGTASPTLASSGGPTQTIPIPAASIAEGAGVKTGLFYRDTTIGGKSDSVPKIAYFSSGTWLALEPNTSVPSGKNIAIIQTDQRGLSRLQPVSIGAFQNTQGEGLMAPMPVTPAYGAYGISISPVLAWNSSIGALSYRVQVSLSPSFTASLSDSSGIIDTTRSLSGLSKGMKYYWRAQTTYSRGTSAWCIPFEFTTVFDPPVAPIAVSPVSGAENQPIASTLVWHVASLAASYRVQVSLAVDFSTILKDSAGIADTTYTPTGLVNNTRYYWRVSASNSGGAGGWMAIAYFTTIVVAPSAPTTVTPAMGATNVTTNPTLIWNALPGAVSYRIQLATDSNFTSPVKDTAGVTDTTFTCIGLAKSIQYFWRVNATNVGGVSLWCTPGNFITIVELPPVPIIVSPVSGAENQPLATIMAWHKVLQARTYQFKVSLNADLSALVKDTSGVVDTSLMLSGLMKYTRYYWAMRAVNSAGSSAWTATIYFVTVSSIPGAPEALLPVDLAQVKADSVILIWQTYNPAVQKFMVEVATDSAMTSLMLSDSSLTDTMVTVKGLTVGTLYWWRVRAWNASGWGPYSSHLRFKYAPAAVLPKQTALHRCSFNGSSSMLRYGLAQRCPVSVFIYNLQGKKVGSFINKVQDPGYYTFFMPMENFSKASYVLVFSAGTFVRKNIIVVCR